MICKEISAYCIYFETKDMVCLFTMSWKAVFSFRQQKKDKMGNIFDKKEHSNIDEHLNKQYQVSLKLHFCHLIFCTFVLTVVYMIYKIFHANIAIILINTFYEKF